jgi:anaerobic ribonucleoside-triphosphate reductase activating protein
MDDKLIDHIKDLMSHDCIEGFTLLGGEPMTVLNVEGTAQLIHAIREAYPDKSIWIYSGYTYEELEKRDSGTVDYVLDMADVLVDGPFDETKKDITLKFRGSSNQRIITSKRREKKNTSSSLTTANSHKNKPRAL